MIISQLNHLNPFSQAAWVIIFTVMGMGIAYFTGNRGEMIWQIAAVGLLFFAGGNPLLGAFRISWKKYLMWSLISASLVATLIIGSAYFIAEKGLLELRSFRLFFQAILLFYLLTHFLVAIYRAVVSLLGRVD